MRIDDRVTNLERIVAEQARAQAGRPVRLGNGGGGGDFYQVVRGICYGSNLDTDDAFQIHNLFPLEDHSLDPTTADPLWIANIPLQAHADGDTVYAFYRQGITVTKTGAPPTVDWEAFAGSNSSTPPVRRFELTAAKLTADATATVKWLDDADNLIGSNVTIYDPEKNFSGRIASYVGTQHGFRGIAELRKDLATSSPQPDRWEIIAMEGFAEFAVVKFYTTGFWKFVSNQAADDQWSRRDPGAVDDQITITDPVGIIPSSPAVDYEILVSILDPDTSPPTYQAVSAKGGSGSPLFQAVVTTLVTAGSSSAMGYGVADISSIGASGALTSVGSRRLNNPFQVPMQVGACVGCELTYNAGSSSDEYTMTGSDLRGISGAGNSKILFIDSSGVMKWDAQVCGS